MPSPRRQYRRPQRRSPANPVTTDGLRNALPALIFGCQLIGELIAVATGWPVPGPVIGMALLFVGLLVHGGVPGGLGGVGRCPARFFHIVREHLNHK